MRTRRGQLKPRSSRRITRPTSVLYASGQTDGQKTSKGAMEPVGVRSSRNDPREQVKIIAQRSIFHRDCWARMSRSAGPLSFRTLGLRLSGHDNQLHVHADMTLVTRGYIALCRVEHPLPITLQCH